MDRVGTTPLRRTQLALLGVVVGLGLVGRSEAFFPIVTWPVYGEIRPERPDTVARLELRVATRSGRRHVLTADALTSASRYQLADRVMRGAAADDPSRRAADRTYLEGLVRAALGGAQLETIEIWRREWRVDPRALPPVERDAPASERRIARFAASSGEDR
jgi:hypothetical protein